jgi:hypothetical protein
MLLKRRRRIEPIQGFFNVLLKEHAIIHANTSLDLQGKLLSQRQDTGNQAGLPPRHLC